MIDVVIVVMYLLGIFGLGLVVSRKVRNQRDYVTGGGNYSSFIIFATVSASFIGGGFTLGLAANTFTYGIVFILAIWGFSLKELLVAQLIAPRMSVFKNKAETVGDIMAIGYGPSVKVFTGIASVLVCGGIIGAQFASCGNILYTFLNIPTNIGSIIIATIVVVYSSLGGLKSVVAADIVHFILLIVILPLVLFFGINHVGGVDYLMNTLPPSSLQPFGNVGVVAFMVLFLSFFFGETLIPPYVQRLLIGKSSKATSRGTLYSAIVSVAFFLVIGLIGLVAYSLNNAISSNQALPYVINTVMPVGWRGLAVAAMMAVVMSSADSFLNATSIALRKDVLVPMGLTINNNSKRELMLSRLVTFVVGIVAIIFSTTFQNVMDILLYSYQFWTPFILVPLTAVIFGVRADAKIFFQSAFCGIITLLCWDYSNPFSVGIEGALEGVIVGILVNSLVFFTLLRCRRSKHK